VSEAITNRLKYFAARRDNARADEVSLSQPNRNGAAVGQNTLGKRREVEAGTGPRFSFVKRRFPRQLNGQ